MRRLGASGFSSFSSPAIFPFSSQLQTRGSLDLYYIWIEEGSDRMRLWGFGRIVSRNRIGREKKCQVRTRKTIRVIQFAFKKQRNLTLAWSAPRKIRGGLIYWSRINPIDCHHRKAKNRGGIVFAFLSLSLCVVLCCSVLCALYTLHYSTLPTTLLSDNSTLIPKRSIDPRVPLRRWIVRTVYALLFQLLSEIRDFYFKFSDTFFLFFFLFFLFFLFFIATTIAPVAAIYHSPYWSLR